MQFGITHSCHNAVTNRIVISNAVRYLLKLRLPQILQGSEIRRLQTTPIQLLNSLRSNRPGHTVRSSTYINMTGNFQCLEIYNSDPVIGGAGAKSTAPTHTQPKTRSFIAHNLPPHFFSATSALHKHDSRPHNRC